MKKRLNARDWILYSLIILLILLLLLVMYQVDRQWSKLDQMQTALSEQAKDLRALRTGLGSGTLAAKSMTPNNDQDTSGVSPAFKRAYAATQQEGYAQGDWSVNSFGNNLKTLTPLVSSDAYSSQVQVNVLETLMTRDPETLEWTGLIAKDWQVSDDGLVITFQLREDVTFSDGVPLTAEDVEFSFDFIMTEAIEAPGLRAVLDKIGSVKATSKYEVVVTYTEPYFRAMSLAGSIDVLPKHFYEPYLKTPQKYNESKAILLGSGPYRLKDPKGWTPDQGTVELVRNDRYWGDVQPSYDRLLWKIIQNESANLTTYRNGGLDAYGVFPSSAKPAEYEKLKEDAQIKAKSQIFNYMPSVAGYSYIGWNQKLDDKATFFADPKVRLAMTYLTDKQRIIDDIYLGYAEPAISPFSPRSKQHEPSLVSRQFDLEKAKSLLKEAGFEDGDGDGVLENSAGEPFEFKLTYFHAKEVTQRMVLLLKDIYALAGIKMIPAPQEWPVMLDQLNNKSFEAIALGWSSGIETDIYQMFHSSQAKVNGDNFINYISPKLDALIDEARSTVNEEKRMALWREAEKVMYEEQPYTFLFRKQTLSFYDKKISNLQQTNIGLSDGFLPMEVYVPTNLQRHTN
uniref:Oligopeptide ABC transporter, periplasmic oligopeptide-binding protein OppA (TC 3.A.1.5.1) n=1 Tax=uncultured Thiotrichaceae bacterium TaxID=298394 RepID=A0A6S6SCB2_9GAMM|nr:MAG: Oligopeptide ABC transporter, periplasmic oligopeptide-binding protein OppA (TC 3.A.1.5.1) [uncultured Thiotrichaceae bacterium]